MSIEAKIDALIAALEATTAALTGAAPKADAPKSTGTKSTGTKGKATKPKGPTAETLGEMATKLLRGETDVEQADAKVALKAFISHFGFKPSETPEDKLEEAHAALKAITEGEDPFEEEGDDDGDMI